MQKITPFLWFDDQAEEAARFYTSIFKNASLGEVRRNGEAGAQPNGSVMTVTFTLEGQEFIALNGGPHYQLTPAISLFVRCATQQEVDALWDRLAEGGKPLRCGWVTDRYGLTWQIIPEALGRMLQDPDPAKARRVMQAMLTMVKLDIAALQRAYEPV